MRMFKPAPGEMVDRMTILLLKLAHTTELSSIEPRGEDTKSIPGEKGKASRVIVRTRVDSSTLNSKEHIFLDELDLVRNHLIDNWIPDIADKPDKVESYDRLYDDLSDINAQLWDLEDQSRVLRSAPNPKDQKVIENKAELLDSISTLNDKRANIVKEINALWNINTSEKLYC